MRGGQNDVAGNGDAAAEAARADQHHDVPYECLVRIHCAADQRGGGAAHECGVRTQEQRAGEGGQEATHRPR